MPSLEGRPYVAVIGSDLGGCVAGSVPDWLSLTMGWHANGTTILVGQERSRFRGPPTQSSEFVPSSCIHSVAAAAQSQDHSVHFPDHDDPNLQIRRFQCGRPDTFRSVLTSAAVLPGIQICTEYQKVVHPCSSQRGSQ